MITENDTEYQKTHRRRMESAATIQDEDVKDLKVIHRFLRTLKMESRDSQVELIHKGKDPA